MGFDFLNADWLLFFKVMGAWIALTLVLLRARVRWGGA